MEYTNIIHKLGIKAFNNRLPCDPKKDPAFLALPMGEQVGSGTKQSQWIMGWRFAEMRNIVRGNKDIGQNITKIWDITVTMDPIEAETETEAYEIAHDKIARMRYDLDATEKTIAKFINRRQTE